MADEHGPDRGDAYLPLRALARYAGLSVRTLRKYLSRPAHPLPHYHVGGKILIKQSEFDRWIETYRIADARQVERILADVLKGL
jgi:excisionase family DNA binding protein